MGRAGVSKQRQREDDNVARMPAAQSEAFPREPIGEPPMSPLGAEHAIVIGAGMGGLAAANAVAPYFNKVSVLDRDALPEGPDVRPGTPQARHAHALLAGGSRALEALFPGIESDMLEAGAVKSRAGLSVRYEQPG